MASLSYGVRGPEVLSEPKPRGSISARSKGASWWASPDPGSLLSLDLVLLHCEMGVITLSSDLLGVAG